MAKGGNGTSRFTVPTTRGNDIIDGSTLDTALQARGLIIDGNAGNDVIKGGVGADLLSGGDGNDYVYGDLADLASASNGATVWDGGKGTDTLDLSLIPFTEGSGTYVRITSGPGTSTSQVWTNVNNPDGSIFGFATGEAKYGENLKGFENVVMGGGDDWVEMATGTGNNVLDGGGGNDVLMAGDGSDVVRGGDGNDMVSGGWGNDLLTGGAGHDLFILLGRLAGEYTTDTVTDFDIDASDSIVDGLWLGATYTVQWDANSAVLHGYMFDNGTAIGEITLAGLTYSDAAAVPIYYGIDSLGMPVPGG